MSAHCPTCRCDAATVVVVGPLEIDLTTGIATLCGELLPMAHRMRQVLAYLALHKDTLCNPQDIYVAVWGAPSRGGRRDEALAGVRHAVRWIRDLLGPHRGLLVSFPGDGYLLTSKTRVRQAVPPPVRPGLAVQRVTPTERLAKQVMQELRRAGSAGLDYAQLRRRLVGNDGDNARRRMKAATAIARRSDGVVIEYVQASSSGPAWLTLLEDPERLKPIVTSRPVRWGTS